jgi:hypothetical protein
VDGGYAYNCLEKVKTRVCSLCETRNFVKMSCISRERSVFTRFVPGGRWDTPPLPATDAEPVRAMVHNEHRGVAVF